LSIIDNKINESIYKRAVKLLTNTTGCLSVTPASNMSVKLLAIECNSRWQCIVCGR